MYSHYTQQVKDTSISLADPHKAYLLRKAVHYFNTQLKYRANIDLFPTNKPIIQVSPGCNRLAFHSCSPDRTGKITCMPSM